MHVHRINDLTNEYVVNLLSSGLSSVEDSELQNYSPEFKTHNSNIFYILNQGRYKIGAYFVVENNGEYVCSSGWNEYDNTTALVLTRSYVAKPYRATYPMATLLLPSMIEETASYQHTWLTCNSSSPRLYEWFVRAAQGKSPAMFNNWPDIYRRFKPIGEKNIYYTPQLVAQLER